MPEATRRNSHPSATLETSAGGVVYRVQHGQPLFLLIRDSYRNWGFPKGHLEQDEAPTGESDGTGLSELPPRLYGKLATLALV